MPPLPSPKRKVLIIAYYFPPLGLSGVQRILKFTKYLPSFGWQPVVLTTGDTKYYAFDDELLNELQDKDIPIYRTPNNHRGTAKYPSKWVQKIGRLALQTFLIPDSRKRWLRPAVSLGEQIFKEHPDINLILATAPPFTDFLVAQELATKHGVPFVVDYRDLWTDNPQSFFPTPYHRYKHRTMEYNIVRQCRKIIVITRAMKEKLLERYKFLDYNDISVIPHGFDAEDFPDTMARIADMPARKDPPKAEPSIEEKLQALLDEGSSKNRNSNTKPQKNSGQKLVITHCGLFPDSRTPKYFLKGVAIFLRKNPAARQHLHLQFVGIMRPQHARLIKRYKLSDITILTGYLPHSEAVLYLQKSDMNWMMLDNNIETPGKFYEYIGAAKLILLCTPDGELRQIGAKYKACFSVNPKDADGVAYFLNLTYSIWQQNNIPTPDFNFIKTFSRQHLTGLLSKELAFAAIAKEEEV